MAFATTRLSSAVVTPQRKRVQIKLAAVILAASVLAFCCVGNASALTVNPRAVLRALGQGIAQVWKESEDAKRFASTTAKISAKTGRKLVAAEFAQWRSSGGVDCAWRGRLKTYCTNGYWTAVRDIPIPNSVRGRHIATGEQVSVACVFFMKGRVRVLWPSNDVPIASVPASALRSPIPASIAFPNAPKIKIGPDFPDYPPFC